MSRCRAVKTTIKTQILYQFVAEMKDMSHQISTEIVTFFSCRFLESVRPLDRWDWAAGEGRLLRARMSSREKTRKLRMMMLISMTLSFKRFSANVEWQWWWTKERKVPIITKYWRTSTWNWKILYSKYWYP